MTQTEGTVFVSVNDTSLAHDSSRIRTRTHFAIPVKIKSILGKFGEVRACNRIDEGDESCTQASPPHLFTPIFLQVAYRRIA